MKIITSQSVQSAALEKDRGRFEDWLSEVVSLAFRLAIAVLLAVILLSLCGKT